MSKEEHAKIVKVFNDLATQEPDIEKRFKIMEVVGLITNVKEQDNGFIFGGLEGIKYIHKGSKYSVIEKLTPLQEKGLELKRLEAEIRQICEDEYTSFSIELFDEYITFSAEDWSSSSC